MSTQFHYIGIAFGIGRYQPHYATDVLGNRYGDCKDKHTLLAALLGAAGIEAYPALINSFRDIDADLPSPSQFDHVITVVPHVNKVMTWLDATQEVAPFGYLAGGLRDKRALVMEGEKPATLVTTPPVSSWESLKEFRMDAKLSDAGTLEGQAEYTEHANDEEVLVRNAFRMLPPEVERLCAANQLWHRLLRRCRRRDRIVSGEDPRAISLRL